MAVEFLKEEMNFPGMPGKKLYQAVGHFHRQIFAEHTLCAGHHMGVVELVIEPSKFTVKDQRQRERLSSKE